MIEDEILLISVKPKFAEKILRGEKTVELRKCMPVRAKSNCFLLIYVTSPVMELHGICRVDYIEKSTPQNLWQIVGCKAGISQDEYFDYFKDTVQACGIFIKDVKKINPIKLFHLKNILGEFNPPQTYAYLSQNEFFKLQNESLKLSIFRK